MPRITFINQTEEPVHLAVFRSPRRTAPNDPIAWRVVAPPPGGLAELPVPGAFRLRVRALAPQGWPTDPAADRAEAEIVGTTAAFAVETPRLDDGAAARPVRLRRAPERLVAEQVRVENRADRAVEVRIDLDGRPVIAPQVVWPRGVFLADLRARLQVAVVARGSAEGQRLLPQDLRPTQVPVLADGRVTVKGSRWCGFYLHSAAP